MCGGVFASDYSSREMCRMDEEGAGERERLVTDTVSRWEVLRKSELCCRAGGGVVGRGGRGEGRTGPKDSPRPGAAEPGQGLRSQPPPVSGATGSPSVDSGKGAGQMREATEVYWGASFP